MTTNILPASHEVASAEFTVSLCRSALVTGQLTMNKQPVSAAMDNVVRCTHGQGRKHSFCYEHKIDLVLVSMPVWKLLVSKTGFTSSHYNSDLQDRSRNNATPFKYLIMGL